MIGNEAPAEGGYTSHEWEKPGGSAASCINRLQADINKPQVLRERISITGYRILDDVMGEIRTEKNLQCGVVLHTLERRTTDSGCERSGGGLYRPSLMHQYPDLEPVWHVLAEPARPLPPDADRFLEAQVGPDGSPNTRLTYMTALRAFWAYRQTLPQPQQYGVDTLTTFVLSGLATHAPDSRQLYLSVATKYLAFLQASGRMDIANSAAMHQHLKVSVGRKRLRGRRREATPAVYLTVETAESLAVAILSDSPGSDPRTLLALRNAAVVHVLLSTGARASEVAGLTRGDVDYGQAATARVRGKGNRVRTVRLDEMAQIAIQRYLHFRRDQANWLFVAHSHRSSAVDPSGLNGRVIWKIVADLWKRTQEHFADRPELASIHVSPHIFRHTVGDTLAKQGASIHAIRQYLGHRSIATTQIYIDDAGDERVMNEIATLTPSRSEALRTAQRRLHLADDRSSRESEADSGGPKWYVDGSDT